MIIVPKGAFIKKHSITPLRRRLQVWPERETLETKLYGCYQDLEKTTLFISRTGLTVKARTPRRRRRATKVRTQASQLDRECAMIVVC